MKKWIGFILCVISMGVNAQLVTQQQTGRDAAGNIVSIPIGGKARSTLIPLAANATWISDTLWYNGNNNIQLAIQSNVSGTYLVEYFMKSGTKIPFMGTTTVFDTTKVKAFQAAIAGKGDGVRVTYINGSIAQNTFYSEIGLLNNSIQETLRSVGIPASATNLAGSSHVFIEGPDSSNAAVYRQVTTSTFGIKTGIDVNVINRSNETQNVNVVSGSITTTTDSTKSRLYQTITNPYIVLASDSSKYRSTINIGNQPNVNIVGFDSTKTRIVQLLPAGASTSANQTTTNGYLATIATNTVNPVNVPFTPYNFDYLASSGVQTVKASPGSIVSIQALNPSTADLFIQFFNTTGAVTLGTTVPTWSQPLDATIGVNFNNISGINFSTGIKYAITTSAKGGGAPSTTVNINLGYR